MKVFKFDVKDANLVATRLKQEIVKQGMPYDEFQSDLFDMYQTTRCKRFFDYMGRMESDYNQGVDMAGEMIQ